MTARSGIVLSETKQPQQQTKELTLKTPYFRRIDDWECLLLEAKSEQGICTLTDSHSSTIQIKVTDLEPYPTHVTATSDFPATAYSLGGQIHEVFWIKDPLTAYAGNVLEVMPMNGADKVRIPLRFAKPCADPSAGALLLAV
jgi:hypothetical protein